MDEGVDNRMSFDCNDGTQSLLLLLFLLRMLLLLLSLLLKWMLLLLLLLPSPLLAMAELVVGQVDPDGVSPVQPFKVYSCCQVTSSFLVKKIRWLVRL